MSTRPLVVLGLAALALAGCQNNPLLVKRSLCPAVAVPAYAGDTTLFAAGDTDRNAAGVDVVATITDVRGTCTEGTDSIETQVNYVVVARRIDATAARQVTLPVFASVVQGGNLLVSKQLSSVTVSFAAGQQRAEVAGGARTRVARSAVLLPPAVQERISRERKPGDLDAATDPLSDPEVRAAVRAASFEVLVGFQLDEAALAYNVTK
ncbi:hypothetical protein [Glacieibacterium frigidum]|uniref:Lipoprotein n=1 Tax=Glacieibacterium frigidum TaxID=2593303 RepID=A0A552UJE5_9SPHN|nr:hypothetical protein [Glacieibacterium frigidum]TRW18291.1 hypothetical protein FMM06_09420 [Glacieibacterium frigidum]